MKRILTTSLLLAATIFAQQFEIAKIPDNGLVILPISQAQAQLRCEGIDLQSQNIPPNSLAIQFPQQLTEKSQRQPLLVTIMPKQPGAETSPKNVAKAFIKGNDFTVDFDQATLGAFPSKITFKSGRVLDNMTWGTGSTQTIPTTSRKEANGDCTTIRRHCSRNSTDQSQNPSSCTQNTTMTKALRHHTVHGPHTPSHRSNANPN